VGSFFLAVVLFLAALILAFLFSQLLSAPIYTRMAAETRHLYTGIPVQPMGGMYADVVLPILSQAQKIALYLVPQIPLLLLNLIPVVGSILYLSVNAIFTMFWIALDYFDYPLDTESNPLTIRDRIRYIVEHLPMTSGFSAMMLLILSIPLVNLLILPVGVIGATLLYCDVKKAESSPDTPL
jgi:CysZ protein